ncbi:MAG TPA: phosphotransferase [Aggregatilineales bacterium]|nr:phosphotransferase [Aggregatilineales bacterium]
MTDSPVKYVYYALILQAGEPLLLLNQGALPTFETTEAHFWQSVSHVNQGFMAITDLKLTTLRCLQTRFDEAQNAVIRYYAIENHYPKKPLLDGMQWVSRDGLADALKVLDQRAIIDQWFEWVGQGFPGPDWYKPTWMHRAGIDLYNAIGKLNRTWVPPTEQLRTWERSALIRLKYIDWPGEDPVWAYFKGVPPMFAHEIPITRHLGELFAHNAPHLLDEDRSERWMVMRDYGSRTLDKETDIRYWEGALTTLAKMQVGSARELIDFLFRDGCPDRRWDWLTTQIEALLTAPAAMLTGDSSALSAAELDELRARLPEFQGWLRALQTYAVPMALEHGDFWPGQVLVQEEPELYTIIDWSDCSISHPFFSLLFLFDDEPGLPDLPDARERLITTYLKVWTDYESLERLRACFDLAIKFAPLYYAAIYHAVILPGMTFKWEMNNMIPFYLKKLLPSSQGV